MSSSLLTSAPRTGTVIADTLRRGIAPLQIATSSGGEDFYVKVQEKSNPGAYKTLFIRGGETLDVKIPLGSYQIKYAAGDNWYSLRCYFGRHSVFSKADKTFKFQRQGNRLTGYRVELILQRDGNMRTSKIKRGDF